MATDQVKSNQSEDQDAVDMQTCSIGVMAYNEEANIGRCLQSLIKQRTRQCKIDEIIVVASGCTDRTEEIVREFAQRDPRIKLLIEQLRAGKASAVNLFLGSASSDILVSVGADTILEEDTIEHLLQPFSDPEIGMTGGHPIPVNDPSTFMGFAAHLLWDMHHQIALRNPKMGELTAYRRVFHRIPFNSAVDEANMEPLIRGQGYQLCYVPNAIVHNRGPETISDFLKQRRRIYAGHLRMRQKQGYSVSTMGGGSLFKALLQSWRWDWQYITWTPQVISLEVYGRMLGWVDFHWKKRDHAVWEVATTTKGTVG